MHRRLHRRLIGPVAIVLALGAPVLAGASGAGAAPPPGPDIISEPVWINGKVASFEATFTGQPTSRARETMFVVGPQDLDHLQEAAHDGGPAHDHVMNHIPYGQRPTCHVWKVVANDGPFTAKVHVRPGGLAHEVDLGEGFVPLVSTDVVVEALVQGLVRLQEPPEQFPDFACWTTRQP